MASINRRGKTFRVRWIDHERKRQSASFDTHREALAFVRKREVEADEIKSGFKSPISVKKTLNEAFDYWLANRAVNKRSNHHDISIIKAHLRPSFGHLLVRQFSAIYTDKYMIEKSVKLNVKTISNHLTLLVSVLRMCADIGWAEKVPKIQKPKSKLFSKEYRFLRTDQEIENFLISTKAESRITFLLYKVAVYTGLREGELAALRVDNLDFANRLITVQRSFNGPTKSNEVRHVPIMNPIYGDLIEWVKEIQSGLLFPNLVGNMHTPSSRLFQEILHRVLKRANFPEREVKGKKRSYIVFHDLRHTFASHWVMKGGDIFKLQKILGHQSIQMTMRYAHLAPHAFNDDWGRFGSNQIEMNSNVIPISRKYPR